MERRDFLRKSALAALGTAVGGTGLVQAFKHIDNGNKNTNRMKITVLTGSPRKSGNSACLAGQFIKGAEEKGHEVFRFDCAFKNVGPCRACNRCGMDGPCIIDDDFSELRPHLVEADMVVFATPMYYFGISAQMKRVIDRFYAINGQIKGAPKKSGLHAHFRRHGKRGSRAHAAALPHADEIPGLDKRGRNCRTGRMDGRGGERHGFSAPGLRIRQEPVAREPAGMRV